MSTRRYELFGYEEGVILRHRMVTQNYQLTRNQLTRAAKRDHLDSLKCTRDEREKILGQLYSGQAA